MWSCAHQIHHWRLDTIVVDDRWLLRAGAHRALDETAKWQTINMYSVVLQLHHPATEITSTSSETVLRPGQILREVGTCKHYISSPGILDSDLPLIHSAHLCSRFSQEHCICDARTRSQMPGVGHRPRAVNVPSKIRSGITKPAISLLRTGLSSRSRCACRSCNAVVASGDIRDAVTNYGTHRCEALTAKRLLGIA
ncbi:hypothetical protein T440DRAFT_269203 [Plenodomus tracheiphilus IPT5]|uniref:Uncharacterized protein n=1 Tax=Plenodomus tracheiphilus IPT5 TaxID=1408161 RepID=A0A6A7BFK2_9PLEO|nr:hypothetical protein T440DRAFT_269203 [Plenodomus tracheiphilus IPT5]